MTSTSPDPAAPRRSARGAQRREALLTVAGELFLAHGYDAVALDDLIARAGGSRSTLYQYFGGKEGLYKAALVHQCAALAEPLAQLSLAEQTPAAALTVLGRHLLQAALAPRALAMHRLLVNDGHRFPAAARAMWEASYGRALDLLTAWIAARQQGPHAPFADTVPAAALAEQFMHMVSGHAKLCAVAGLLSLPLAPATAERMVAQAVHTFLQGVRRDCPAPQGGVA